MLTLKPIFAFFSSSSSKNAKHGKKQQHIRREQLQKEVKPAIADKSSGKDITIEERGEKIGVTHLKVDSETASPITERSSVSINEALSVVSATATATGSAKDSNVYKNYSSEHVKVEFDQSRHLLELDFFQQQDLVMSFPQFDYLLRKSTIVGFEPEPTDAVSRDKPAARRFSNISDKLTMKAIRRKISVYNKWQSNSSSSNNEQQPLHRSKSAPNLA
ncbi:hypothetical protein BDF20DRAFT_908700 [Mycotypha africana]|uniref:uncharacterized protein n=1 Tax=Mycotypha africana TaxID=64632 RepID=UPI002301E10A|nr:uncharacterized protein BDF20DRAFT_908700 [Mycotypha africana]KAI8990863.1 hypothetical protein BDF20DRAFT_908700 [Mycotypha africana]